jgi:hypothetical protein
MATQSDSTNTGVVATIVAVGSFAMIAISVMLTAMVRTEAADVEKGRPGHADLETVAALDKQQLASLTAEPHWLDKPNGKVAIPIDVAMRLVVDDFKKNPAAASPPPPPGLVMPPPAPEQSGDTSAAAGAAPAPAAGVAPVRPAASVPLPATAGAHASAPAGTPEGH